MDEGSGIGMAIELLAREQRFHPNTRVNGTLNFAISLDQEEPFTLPMSPLPQTNDLFDPCVL
jgi:hypothetical protein|tara:strand:+ start:468 stop:653 length:186 start_codon:yes stop_codon:yes gene_type:complete